MFITYLIKNIKAYNKNLAVLQLYCAASIKNNDLNSAVL